jgi:phosphohistidine phosphatase
MVTADNHCKTLYLVRHGEAVSKDEDPARPLTQSGWIAVERIARWAGVADVRPDEIVHNGKLRAEQTAEILADYLMPAKGSNVRRGLGPDDDVRPFADSLAAADRTLMIVGHLPFLGRLVSRLVVGDADRPVVQFEAAGLVSLAYGDGHWTIGSVIDPDLLP